MSQQDVKEIYSDMLIELDKHIYDDNEAMRQFRIKLKGKGITPADRNCKYASDICSKLFSSFKIELDFESKTCNFEFLKGCIIDKEILEVVQKYENKIRANMKLEPLPAPRADKLPVLDSNPASPSDQHLLCTSSTSGTGYENQRRQEDVALPYSHLQAITNNKIDERVGRIKIQNDKKIEYGTVFRVGRSRVMTAYHVMQSRIKYVWKEIRALLEQLSEEDTEKLVQKMSSLVDLSEYQTKLDDVKDSKSLYKFMVQNGHWWEDGLNFSLITKALDQINKTFLAQEIEKKTVDTFGKKMEILFSYREEIFYSEGLENVRFFCLKKDFPYGSKSEDIIIMDLIPVRNNQEGNVSYGDPFPLTTQNMECSMYITGHPKGSILQVDPKVELIKSMEKLECIKQEARKHWIEHFKNLDQDTVDKGYIECTFNENIALFHCSETVAHCASGSPGFLLKDGSHPVVQFMLQGGVPKFFYNSLSLDQKKLPHVRPHHLIEKGITMKRVSELLKQRQLTDLHTDIFVRE